jgi:nitroreductase
LHKTLSFPLSREYFRRKDGNLIPSEKKDIRMENSIENLEWRYAVKKFDSERILPSNKVEKLKQAFNLTATSYGLQPIKMVVVQNKQLQAQLVSLSMGQKQVSQASHVLVLCIERSIDADYIFSYFEKVKSVRGTSEAILAPFKESLTTSFSEKDSEEVEAWSKNQAYLALGNLLTICAMEKIDSCPMEGFSPEGYDEVLSLKEKGLTSVLVLPVGYRAEDDVFSTFKKVRRNLEDSIIEIT